jgi:hypothetical protein
VRCQTRSSILEERAKRHDYSALRIEKVGLDSLAGGDDQARDLVLPPRCVAYTSQTEIVRRRTRFGTGKILARLL